MDESQRGKYTFAVHNDVQQDPDRGRDRGNLQGQGRGCERADDQVKGEARRDASEPDRRPNDPLAQAIVTLAPGEKIEFFEAV